MSFGFGIGDFITVLQLVNEVRTQYAYAPEEFKELHSRSVLPFLSTLKRIGRKCSMVN